ELVAAEPRAEERHLERRAGFDVLLLQLDGLERLRQHAPSELATRLLRGAELLLVCIAQRVRGIRNRRAERSALHLSNFGRIRAGLRVRVTRGAPYGDSYRDQQQRCR